MTNFRRFLTLLVGVLAMQMTSAAAWAQAGTGTHVLDGTQIDWTYTDSDARMVVSFEGGLGQYEWIAGGRTGNSDEDIPYSSREISPNVFLMSWIQADRPDFITMIFDFNNMTISTSGLMGYTKDDPRFLFLDGTINSFDR